MTTKAQTKPKAPGAGKLNDKFKVYPGLSLKGRDIMIRLRNGSLQLQEGGQYNLDKDIEKTRRMSKLDLAHASQQIQEDIRVLGDKLNQSQSKP